MWSFLERLVELMRGWSECLGASVAVTLLLFACDVGLVANVLAQIARFAMV